MIHWLTFSPIFFSRSGSSKWLSDVNAMISQIDLGCKSIAPAITGVLFSVMPANAVSILMVSSSVIYLPYNLLTHSQAIINFAVALLLLNFMTHIYHQVPKLATKNVSVEATETDVEAAADKLRKNMPTDISLNKKYFFYDFINSGCCGMMVAYSFLYLTVLSFGSLMIVYLRWVRYILFIYLFPHVLTYIYSGWNLGQFDWY